jgi:hypothetical protein
MSSETKAKINKMLFHLSNENRAGADKELQQIIKLKTQKVFDQEYQRIKNSFAKEIK